MAIFNYRCEVIIGDIPYQCDIIIQYQRDVITFYPIV
jgi:hypothetical protein